MDELYPFFSYVGQTQTKPAFCSYHRKCDSCVAAGAAYYEERTIPCMLGDSDSATPLSVATVATVAACRASCNARQSGAISTRCLSALYDREKKSCSLFAQQCTAGSAQPLDDTKENRRVSEARSAYNTKQQAQTANNKKQSKGRRKSTFRKAITEVLSSGTTSTDEPVTVTSYNRFIVPAGIRGYRTENGYDGTGFHLSIQGVDINSGRCKFDSNDGTLSSPNYPNPYQGPNSCEFSVYSEGIVSVEPGFVLESGASLVVKRRKVKGYTLIKAGNECKSSDTQLRSSGTLEECNQACISKSGCAFFSFGINSKAGRCYWEKTSSKSCPEGWLRNSYDFYEAGSNDRNAQHAWATIQTMSPDTAPLIVQPGDLIVFDTTSQKSNKDGMWQLNFKMIPQVAKRYGRFKKRALALRSRSDGWIQMPKKKHRFAQVQRSNYNVETCTDECQHHAFFALTGVLNGIGKCYCTDQWSTVIRVDEMNVCSGSNVGNGEECVHVYSTFSGHGDTSAEGDVEIKLLSQGINPTVVKNLGSCQLEPRPSDPEMCALMECSNMDEVDVTDAVTSNSKLRFDVLARNVKALCPADNGDLESVHVEIVLYYKKNCVLRQAGVSQAGANNPLVTKTSYYDCDED